MGIESEVATVVRRALVSLPRREQSILALYAFDFRPSEIAELLGMSREKVTRVINVLYKDESRAIEHYRRYGISVMLQVLAFEALRGITPDDIAKMSCKERLAFARTCIDAFERINVGPLQVPRGDFNVIGEIRDIVTSTTSSDNHGENASQPAPAPAAQNDLAAPNETANPQAQT